jgi:hypothetical protein
MMTIDQRESASAVLITRRTVAFPIYMLSLSCDLARFWQACVAAWIAGDDWPVR